MVLRRAMTDYKLEFGPAADQSIRASASLSHIRIVKGDIATFKVCVQLSADCLSAVLGYADRNERIYLIEKLIKK